MPLEAIDLDVRREVYDVTMRTGSSPSSATVAQILGITRDAVLASFERLAEARMLVLQRDTREVLMAPPYSNVPTPFAVDIAGHRTYGNCIWDALGVAAMLRADARIDTSCGDCGTSAEVFVEGDRVRGEGLIHFALPTRDWWKDVVFT